MKTKINIPRKSCKEKEEDEEIKMLFGLLNLTFSSSNFVSHHSIQGMRHHRNVVHWWIFLVRKEDKPRITYCWLLNFYFTSLFFFCLFKNVPLPGRIGYIWFLIVIENLNWQKTLFNLHCLCKKWFSLLI